MGLLDRFFTTTSATPAAAADVLAAAQERYAPYAAFLDQEIETLSRLLGDDAPTTAAPPAPAQQQSPQALSGFSMLEDDRR